MVADDDGTILGKAMKSVRGETMRHARLDTIRIVARDEHDPVGRAVGTADLLLPRRCTRSRRIRHQEMRTGQARLGGEAREGADDPVAQGRPVRVPGRQPDRRQRHRQATAEARLDPALTAPLPNQCPVL